MTIERHPLDCETYPIHPGRLAPPVVCLQDHDGIHVGPDIRARFEWILASGRVIVGHSIAYDMAVLGAAYPDLLPAMFEAYDDDRVVCTMVREKLVRVGLGIDKTAGSYSLAASCERYGIDHGYNVDADGNKAEAWRVRYGELECVPVAEWHADARRYALLDVVNLDHLWDAQEAAGVPLEDQYRQTRADFSLHLMTAWGMRTDPHAVDAFIEATREEHAAIRAALARAGLVRPDGRRNQAAARDRMERVRKAAGLEIPRTDTGAVSLDADACRGAHDHAILDYADDALPERVEERLEGVSVLEAYARYGSVKTLISRAERLRHGTVTPLQPRYDVLKETGRTSCSQGKGPATWGFQVQNVHREPGLRECFVPRAGNVLIAVDWTGAELHTFAQACIDLGIPSRLADALNAGRNAHDVLAGDITGKGYEWILKAKTGELGQTAKAEAKTARQAAKAANFGYPGGMGAGSFREFAAAQYGVILSPQQARALKQRWQTRTPESVRYFEMMNAIVERGDGFPHLRSGRWRRGATYCATCNSLFQGLAADMAKDAAFVLARACYVGELSPARPVAFIHDEFLVEAPEERGHEVAMVVVEIMEDAGRRWCPDVPVSAEPSMMRRWSKFAEPVWDEDGRLMIWES